MNESELMILAFEIKNSEVKKNKNLKIKEDKFSYLIPYYKNKSFHSNKLSSNVSLLKNEPTSIINFLISMP
ncbi:MAG: hypothetical protein JWM09_745 [Francisellaceae bacterium]|nr:hypothetical protein [Francisellaceae bacterium]